MGEGLDESAVMVLQEIASVPNPIKTEKVKGKGEVELYWEG